MGSESIITPVVLFTKESIKTINDMVAANILTLMVKYMKESTEMV